MGYIYFDAQHAIKTHDKILEISSGRKGMIKDGDGRLESILEHIQNDDYYPTFEEKLTQLVFAVNKGHCFQDGNKRTSLALGAFFLEVNGLDVIVSKFMIEMENIAVSIADNLIDKELLGEIIVSILTESEYNEELKLKIISALDTRDIPSDNVDI